MVPPSREDVYKRQKNSFVTVQTSEDALYACMILKKGVIGEFSGK